MSLNSAGDRVAIGAYVNDGSGMYYLYTLIFDMIYKTVLIEYVYI